MPEADAEDIVKHVLEENGGLFAVAAVDGVISGGILRIGAPELAMVGEKIPDVAGEFLPGGGGTTTPGRG